MDIPGKLRPLPVSALTLVKLGVVLLGLFNLTLTFTFTFPGSLSQSPSSTIEPRRIRVKNYPELELLHLDIPDFGPRILLTEETVHYPVNGTLADIEWESLVPEGKHGLVLLGPDARPYAVTMFHVLHCLNRIRKAIINPSDDPQARYHVHHCFNYVRQMALCGADTRLNPTNHVQSSGQLATDGIGLMYECRDWGKVYEAFEANHALNRTMTFAT